jgi:hypothetical protein
MLDLEAARRWHVGSVAFRYTQAVIDVIPTCLDLNVQDLDAQSRECPDERIEDSTFRRKPEFDLRQGSSRTVDERDQRFGDAQHVRPQSMRRASSETLASIAISREASALSLGAFCNM